MPALQLSLISAGIGAAVGGCLWCWAALTTDGPTPILGAVVILLFFAGLGFLSGAIWRLFEKAGYHGGASLIPVYNLLVLHDIAGLPLWLLPIWLIPGLNFLMLLTLYYGISKNFGQGALFTLGLLLFGFVLFPVLAFGDYEHTGEWELTL